MYRSHKQQRGNGNLRVVAEYIIRGCHARKLCGICQFRRDSHIIASQRCGNDGRRRGNNACRRQRTHARLNHNRVQRRQENDRQVGGAGHNQ